MSSLREETLTPKEVFLGGCVVLLVIIAIWWGIAAGMKLYGVWSHRKEGEAELAKAESNRQIKTLEAKALMESSKFLADAEILRAKGVAEANRIIGTCYFQQWLLSIFIWQEGRRGALIHPLFVAPELLFFHPEFAYTVGFLKTITHLPY